MTSTLLKRIEKLESRRRNDDEALLLWIKPDDDPDAAISMANRAGLFGSGDLMICGVWLGDEPMPKPRWLKRSGDRLSQHEEHCLSVMLEKRIALVDALVATGDPEAQASELGIPMPRDLSEVSSVDLIVCALGVKT